MFKSRRKIGAALLEFAFVLPMFLFMITFAIDMGRMTFISAVLQDSAFTSARAGAQVGGAGSATTGESRKAFDSAVALLPTGQQGRISGFKVATGATCVKEAPTTSTRPDNRYVTIKIKYTVPLITPGLRKLLDATAPNEGPWQLGATGIARCEVVRSAVS
jgi:Flp pilus assembly protein TadG